MFSALLGSQTGRVSVLRMTGPDENTYRFKYLPPSNTTVTLTSREMRHMVVGVVDQLLAKGTFSSLQSGGSMDLWSRIRRVISSRALDGGPHGEVQWTECTDDEQFNKAPGDIISRLYGITEPYCYVQTVVVPDKEFASLASMIYTTRSRKAEFQSVFSAIKERWPCAPADVPPLEIVTGLYGSMLDSREEVIKIKNSHSNGGEDMVADKTAVTQSIIKVIVEKLKQEHPLLESMGLEVFDFQDHQAEVRELKSYMEFVYDDASADEHGQSAVVMEDV